MTAFPFSGGGDGSRDGAGPRELRLGVAADLALVGDVRRQVREHLESQRVPEDACDSLVLVVDEVVSNSIEHGSTYRRNGDRMELAVRVDGDELLLRFVDRDVPAAEVRMLMTTVTAGGGDEPPPLDWERGRGMFLIAMGLDDLVIQPLDRATGDGLVLEGRKFSASR